MIKHPIVTKLTTTDKKKNHITPISVDGHGKSVNILCDEGFSGCLSEQKENDHTVN